MSTDFLKAVSDGNMPVLNRMLAEDPKLVDNRDAAGETPLLLATAQARTGAAEQLVKRGADINAGNAQGETPLFIAARNGNAGMVQLLLSLGADPNIRNHASDTPLHLAASNGHTEVVRLLAGTREYQAAPAEKPITPLHSSREKHKEAKTIPVRAPHTREEEVTDVTDVAQMLFRCIRKGDLKSIRRMLVLDSQAINATRPSGEGLLHYAVRKHNPDAVLMLLKAQAAPEARDVDGRTPLHLAAGEGQCEIARMLINHGAQIDAAGDDGCTPLSYAAHEGHADAVELLLDQGVKIETRDKWGRTPLHLAARQGHLGAAECLIKRGAEINTQDNSGRTPMDRAGANADADMISLLRRNRGAETVDMAMGDFTPPQAEPLGTGLAALDNEEVEGCLNDYEIEQLLKDCAGVDGRSWECHASNCHRCKLRIEQIKENLALEKKIMESQSMHLPGLDQ